MRYNTHTRNIGMVLIISLLIMSTAMIVYADGIDSDTVLMLHADGDDSFSIGTGYGIWDGDADHVTLTDDPSLDFSGNDHFTFSLWFKTEDPEERKMFIDKYLGAGAPGYYIDWFPDSEQFGIVLYDDVDTAGAGLRGGDVSYIDGAWHHMVVVFDGYASSDSKIYLDGTAVATGQIDQPGNFSNDRPLYIGTFSSTLFHFAGMMDDVTVFNRSLSDTEVDSLYQRGLSGLPNNITADLVSYYPMDSDFSDAAGSNDGALQGDTHIEGGHLITIHGDPGIVTDGSIGGAMAFDGAGDYLTLPDSVDLYFGADDFTMDYWIEFDSLPVDGIVFLFSQRYDYNVDSNFYCYYQTSSGYDRVVCSFINATQTLTYDWVPSLDTWYHMALVRHGDELALYMDGQKVATKDLAGLSLLNSAQELYIGAGSGAGNPVLYMDGSFDEFRISSGARWTSAFTPETEAYESDIDTKYLLHFDGDVSDSGHNFTWNGDGDISATTYRFDGSYIFDGSGDYLSIPVSSDFDFSTDDFTIDAWIRRNVAGVSHTIVSTRNGASSYAGFGLSISSDKLRVIGDINSASPWDVDAIGTTSIGAGSWHHVALVRSSGTLKGYLDGNEEFSTAFSGRFYFDSSPLIVGAVGSDGGYPMNGYIDELRISKGIARWTSDFTPDTTPYTISAQQSPTVTESNYTEFASDSETTNFTAAADPTNITAPVIANSFAKVQWIGSGFNAAQANLDDAIEFANNFVHVDSAVLSTFNARANITFKGVSYADTAFIQLSSRTESYAIHQTASSTAAIQ